MTEYEKVTTAKEGDSKVYYVNRMLRHRVASIKEDKMRGGHSVTEYIPEPLVVAWFRHESEADEYAKKLAEGEV